jgi:hypothetical protein
MKPCNSCEQCGCPKCLGTGFDLEEEIFSKIKNPKTGEKLSVDDFHDMTVSDQRMVKNLINMYIKLNSKG